MKNGWTKTYIAQDMMSFRGKKINIGCQGHDVDLESRRAVMEKIVFWKNSIECLENPLEGLRKNKYFIVRS